MLQKIKEHFKSLALKHNGKFHGPNIEHLSIPEEDFYEMMSKFNNNSYWSCFEMHCMACDLSYDDYIHQHTARHLYWKPMTKEQYETIDKLIFSFDSINQQSS